MLVDVLLFLLIFPFALLREMLKDVGKPRRGRYAGRKRKRRRGV
jgi:hypothetical protein